MSQEPWTSAARFEPPTFFTNMDYAVLGKATSLIATGNDGHLYILTENHGEDSVSNLSVVAAKRIHQSSIKAVSITNVGGWYWVLTGGDDNAAALSLVHNQFDAGGIIITTYLIPNAHAAGITGAYLLSSPIVNKIWAVTSSTDETIKRWEFDSSNPNEIHLDRAWRAKSTVADISDMDVCVSDSTTVIVCGVGLESWDVNATHDR
jgi:hypothetical protein